MKYEFNLSDYEKVMDIIRQRDDILQLGFDTLKVAEKVDSELYARGCRVVIPALRMAFREGVALYRDGDGVERVPTVILYPDSEKDPTKYVSSYSGLSPVELLGMIAEQDENEPSLQCFIDDEEFVLRSR